ncbi:MAG TPA: hypothetical protein VJT85_07855, partial [Gemmatimonadaceae bacterium]|nr:hypothetical protein [Gemmatimonadaceae bacterium]
MSHLAANVSLVLSLMLTFAQPTGAQVVRHSVAPAIDALSVGARSADAADSTVAAAVSATSPEPRATALDGDAIFRRRERFMNVGSFAGAVGGVVWAYQATKNDMAVVALP